MSTRRTETRSHAPSPHTRYQPSRIGGVPAGDVYLLKQILHDWDDEQCVTLLKNCVRAMRSGGKVVVVEMVVPEDGSPSMAQMMDLNMMVLLPGREGTEREFSALFEAAGLTAAKVTPTQSPFSLLEATPV